MKTVLLMFGIAGLLMFAACTESDGGTTADSSSDQPTQVAEATQAAPAEAVSEPTAPITLASGEKVDVIGVGYFDENMKDLGGLVAIEGKVKEAHPDRGALILVDCAVEAGCTDGCCPDAEVPVRLDLTQYSGSLPDADTEIVVIGDLTVSDLGYELAVHEIRHGEEVLLSKNA